MPAAVVGAEGAIAVGIGSNFVPLAVAVGNVNGD